MYWKEQRQGQPGISLVIEDKGYENLYSNFSPNPEDCHLSSLGLFLKQGFLCTTGWPQTWDLPP